MTKTTFFGFDLVLRVENTTGSPEISGASGPLWFSADFSGPSPLYRGGYDRERHDIPKLRAFAAFAEDMTAIEIIVGSP
ncbi:hypothetical protein [Devosia riboflavina]|uniref:hypothetical protein n=1 Tax=Devosia riboflavina TaxID=46914 RepID=UPI001269CB8A|nr:hypothetical protein [Devosia riboflavina]